MLEKITQSLAGRTGIVRLLPLSLRELTAFGITTGSVDEFLYRGFYPHLYATAGDPSHQYVASHEITWCSSDRRTSSGGDEFRVMSGTPSDPRAALS